MESRNHRLGSASTAPPPALWRPANAESVTVPKRFCEDQYCLFQPQINAEGVHFWPFDRALPVDVRFLACDGRNTVQRNRHDYFEVFFLCSGPSAFHVQDRLLPMNEGDLSIIGSTLHHSAECPPNSRATIAALFFDPDLIRSDGSADSAHYLAPFLLQDAKFPHIVPGKTGVPSKVFDLMQSIRSELPGSSIWSRLAIKTYLKMILTLLVNQYSSHATTVETFHRQQRALDRFRPLFEFLDNDIGTAIQLSAAARLCGMSESHFMNFFKRVTGRSFMDYLKHRRVEQAQVLLANTDRPISDIAQEVGFCAQSYFGSIFHKLVGMTPAAYRRYHHNGG